MRQQQTTIFDPEDSADIMDEVEQVQYDEPSEKAVQITDTPMASLVEAAKTEKPSGETLAIVQTSKPRTILLASREGDEFILKLAESWQSTMIRSLTDGDCIVDAIPLFQLSTPVLSKVIQYWKRHTGARVDEELRIWDQRFFKALDKKLLIELLLAAECLEADELRDATSQFMADTIKDMEVEQVRDYFGIKNSKEKHRMRGR